MWRKIVHLFANLLNLQIKHEHKNAGPEFSASVSLIHGTIWTLSLDVLLQTPSVVGSGQTKSN